MEKISLSSVLNRLGVQIERESNINLISTNSKEISQGSIFVALVGEKFDGHDYVKQAIDQGAEYVVVQKKITNISPQNLIMVESTEQALLDIANEYRNQRNVKITAITGSVGKTSTKEMIATILEQNMPTLKTQANLNNQIGVPKTIFDINDNHKSAVIEMGMDHFGEIEALSKSVQPDIAVVTNIGVSHLENLGSVEGILKAKMEILLGLKEGSPLIICGDSPMLKDFKDERFKIYRYGITDEKCDIKAENINQNQVETWFDIIYDNKRYKGYLPTIGKHNVLNSLCGFMVGILYGLTPEQIISAMSKYKTTGMRQNIVRHKDFTIVEDCYNASPDSMYTAIDTLGSIEAEKKILVLSEMLELGMDEKQLHKNIGLHAENSNIDLILCTGKLSQSYGSSHKIKYFEDKDQLFQGIKKELCTGVYIWFKASRGMKLEEVIEKIYKEC